MVARDSPISSLLKLKRIRTIPTCASSAANSNPGRSIFRRTRLTRPMTDRTKETLFNIVGSFVFGKHVLDLYAGSAEVWAWKLSAAARSSATFVDQAPWAQESDRKKPGQASAYGSPRDDFVRWKCFRRSKNLRKTGADSALIFVDPPFMKGLVKKTLMRLDSL